MKSQKMNKSPVYFLLKRCFDVLSATVGLIGTSPLWILAVLGIELSDPGAVFYMARRVGKNGKEFRMFKFRSMRVAKDANESNFKADVDRVFKFGAFMRATKIDELPQLLNVIGGSMSVVGPRPASVDQVEVVRAGEYAVVNDVKPGLSGPSALYDYVYGDTVEDEAEYEKLVLPTRLKLDVYYVKKMGVRYDLKIIWQTVICILSSFGCRSIRKRILNELIANVKEN